MPRFVFDTDHLTLFDLGDVAVTTRFAKEPKDSVGLTVVTVEEYLRGRLAAISKAKKPAIRIHRYELLAKSVQLFQTFPIIPYDQRSEDHFQQLRSLRVGNAGFAHRGHRSCQ